MPHFSLGHQAGLKSVPLSRGAVSPSVILSPPVAQRRSLTERTPSFAVRRTAR
jgi:hypothetical protein